MSKTGKKLINALEQAAQSAKCEHAWVLADETTWEKRVYDCPHCGCRKTEFVPLRTG